MPRVPLHTKLKQAFLGYLETADPLGGDLRAVLAGFAFVNGVRGGNATLPFIAVTVPRSVPRVPTAKTDRGRVCMVEVIIETAAKPGADKTFNEASDAHDLIAQTVMDALVPQLVRPFVNSEGASRPVADFFLGNFNQPDFESDFVAYTPERKTFTSILTFKDVYAIGTDGDAAP